MTTYTVELVARMRQRAATAQAAYDRWDSTDPPGMGDSLGDWIPDLTSVLLEAADTIEALRAQVTA